MNLVSAACLIQSEACVATTRSRGSLTVQNLASCQELTDWKRTFNWVMRTEVSVAGMFNMLGTPPGHQPLHAAQLLLGTNQRGQGRFFCRGDVYARIAVVSSWPVSRSFQTRSVNRCASCKYNPKPQRQKHIVTLGHYLSCCSKVLPSATLNPVASPPHSSVSATNAERLMIRRQETSHDARSRSPHLMYCATQRKPSP